MPFDLDTTHSRTETPRQRQDRHWVAGWLFVICGMLLGMIVLGGATRLTGSGLSIMEWDPIMGALPPLSDAEWQRLFKLYQAIPQYQLINQGFGLDGFKHIFWLEWTHRLWGRLIGFAFAIPLIVFTLRGAIRRGLWLRLGGFFILGGLQGAVGWFMVASGFAADSTAVSAYRLVAHLALALALYAAILWTGLSVLRPGARRLATAPLFRVLLSACCVLVGLTIVAGGFVAGLHAGLLYNTFPLMGDGLAPPDYAALHPFLRNLTENLAAVQFDHRLLATATATLVLVTAWGGLRATLPRPVRVAVGVMVVAVLIQYTLGVCTLLWVVPVDLAVAHQATAVVLLTASLVALQSRSPQRVMPGDERHAMSLPSLANPTCRTDPAQARFLATMSHELRTPLNVVIGYSEALQSDPAMADGQVAEYATAINEAGRQLLALVDVILDVARVESGHAELPSDLIDIGRLVLSGTGQFGEAARNGQLALSSDVPADLPLLRGDERRLRDALRHLIANAVKFTPAWRRDPGGGAAGQDAGRFAAAGQRYWHRHRAG